MTARNCGGCTLCCQLVGVAELGKRSFETCRHMRTVLHAEGPGCGIYDIRPRSCTAWKCVWLKSTPTEGWRDDERPDRVGFVVDEIIDLVRINGREMPVAQIWVAPGHEEDWRRDPARAIILALCNEPDQAVLWRLSPGTHARCFVKSAKTGGIEATPAIAADKLGSLGPENIRSRKVQKIFAERAKRQ